MGTSRLARIILITALGVALAASVAAQVEEYQVKAAFLYNFVRFVEWPPKSFNSPSDPVAICILGENPFGDALGEAIRGKVLDGRSITVHLISEGPPKFACQVLFVASSGRKRFRSMAADLKGTSILTVGDAPGFIDEGGIINFKSDGGRIRFEVSVEAAEQAQLIISSKLLSLANIVKKQRVQ